MNHTKRSGVKSGAPEGLAVPPQLVIPVVLIYLQTSPMTSHEGGKEWEVFTTGGTYPWSCVIHSGQSNHNDFNFSVERKQMNT